MEKNQGIVNRAPTMLANRKTSLTKLIIWNVSKAIEKNSRLDLQKALKSAQERVDSSKTNLTTLIPDEYAEDGYINCALLAWQQLGHRNADSLYEFIRSKKIENGSTSTANTLKKYTSNSSMGTLPSCNPFVGPVVTLPLHTSIVMRVENTPGPRKEPNPKLDKAKEIMEKIDEVCCQEHGCVERLAAVEAATEELRMRAARLAKREADRIELFERAEAAWKDLELGFNRRMRLAREKENSITNQVPKSIEERNNYKSACVELVKQLKQKTEKAESDRSNLSCIEQQICQHGCSIVRLRDDAIKADTQLTKYHCGATQQDRDTMHKEDQSKRKLSALENELDAVNDLINETERAVQLELVSLREQVARVSKQLLEQDSDNARVKAELEPINKFMSDLLEDLDSCKTMCDENMKSEMEELKKKRDLLRTAKDKFKECRCKIPVDENVEVKRTPSVAIVCYCEPEDRLSDGCSCTTLRKRLLSDLLSDLFSGLQAELGNAGAEMPCQLLKCLEDSHNWDRASDAKNNLRNYFARLLTGELDIAIATSIEKYHAKWIGNTCADATRMMPDSEFDEWQDKAVERKAQKLATQLAEQLFKDKEKELTDKAKQIVAADPPCSCTPRPAEKLYHCLIPTTKKKDQLETPTTSYWQRACQDVTLLRAQIEDLKKETIKKEDLKFMEEKIAKAVKVTMGGETSKISRIIKKNQQNDAFSKINKALNTEPSKNMVTQNKNIFSKKRSFDVAPKRVKIPYPNNIERDKSLRIVKQSYAVNLCLCSTHKDTEKIKNQSKLLACETVKDIATPIWKNNEFVTQVLTIKQSKPIERIKPIEETQELVKNTSTNGRNKKNGNKSGNECVACFHKIPSNSSIDKLLDTLVKWKCDLKKSVENRKEVTGEIQPAEQTLIDSENSKNDKIKPIESAQNRQNLPAATESEYMGAVNLDKSNDLLSNIKSNKKLDTDDKKSILKCNHSDPCSCCIMLSQSVLEGTTKGSKIGQPLGDVGHELPAEKNISKEKADCDSLSISNVDVNAKSPDCDYKIKFLGVTLTNTNKTPVTGPQNNESPSVIYETSSTKNDGKQQLNDKIIDQYRNRSNVNCDNISLISKDLNEAQNSQQKPDEIMSNSEQKQNSDCSSTLKHKNESKNENPYNKQRGDFLQTKDENVDVQSFRNVMLDESESCVCCDKKLLNEAENLETNTFKLLEEHLRLKLEEFKSSCISSCMTPEEEEKMFNKIIEKVKQIIRNTTENVVCKCSKEGESEGSWARAYSLLQEYLKTKLNRVKCSCISNKEEDQKLLPDVLTKVCQSIEDDFKRLEDLCTCKSLPKSKGNNSAAQSVLKNQVELTDQDDNKCDIYFNSKYPMEATGQPNNKTFLNKTGKTKGNGTVVKFNNNLIEANNSNLFKECNLNPALPYIGLTVECSCTSNISPCSCSKSLAQANSNQVNSIWNNALNSKPDQKVISYIMDKSHNNRCNKMYEVNFVETATEIAPTMKNNSTQWINMMCDTQISASNIEEIVLKKSFENLYKNQSLKKTETFDENLSIGTSYENPMDRYESEHLSQNERTSSNTSHLAKILDANTKQFDVSNYLKLNKFIDHINESHVNNISKSPSSLISQDCDCSMVPICHVKLLMENIENKLFNSKCTCDSLSSKVCPIHAKVI